MKSQEFVIRIIAEERPDGTFLISSPELPLLHLAIQSEDDLDAMVLPVVIEMIKRTREGHKVSARRVDILPAEPLENIKMPRLPAHIIARVAA